MTVLPTMPKDILKQIYDAIMLYYWKSKTRRIAMDMLIKKKEQGGLRTYETHR